MTFPWHQSTEQSLVQAFHQDRLPHGLLLSAREGTGARDFLNAWCKRLLCHATTFETCNHCKNCLLFEAKTHPDFYWLEVLPDKKQIAVAQVRELTQKLREKPSISKWRVAVIFEAEKLTITGYNALLKTLEEPGESTQLILVSRNRASIPATIISRCQYFELNPTQQHNLTQWVTSINNSFNQDDIQLALALSDNAPLKAIDMLKQGSIEAFQQQIDLLKDIISGKQNYLVLSENYKNQSLQMLQWWEMILSQLIKIKSNCEPDSVRIEKLLSQLAEKLSLQLLFQLREDILLQTKELRDGISLNVNMQLDQLALKWSQCRQNTP